jgi:hypothetical protein
MAGSWPGHTLGNIEKNKRILKIRGLEVMRIYPIGTRTLAVFNSSDTLFVRQRTIDGAEPALVCL